MGKEEEQEDTPPPCRTLPPPCSIPRRLVISPSLGGTPVTPQLTEVTPMMKLAPAVNPAVTQLLMVFRFQNLRKILFGGTFHVFNYEWRKSFFQFRELNSELSYALETDRVRTGTDNTCCTAVRGTPIQLSTV